MTEATVSSDKRSSNIEIVEPAISSVSFSSVYAIPIDALPEKVNYVFF